MSERTFQAEADDFIAAFALEHDLGPVEECEALSPRRITYTFQSGVSVSVRLQTDGTLAHKVYG